MTPSQQAKAAGKISSDYEIPAAYRRNMPDRIASALKPLSDQGELPVFPFGSDFTEVELRLLPALQVLKSATPMQLAALAMSGITAGSFSSDVEACLARLDLSMPQNLTERIFRYVIIGALTRV